MIDKSRQIDLQKTLVGNKIDIAFIQETHLRHDKNVFLDGYSFINLNTPVGVAIAIRNNISYKRVYINDLGFNGVFVELELKIRRSLKKILIGSLYIPTNCSSLLIEDGLNRILNAASNCEGFILGGDLNSKSPTWGDTIENCNGKCLGKWLQDNSLDVVRLCDVNPSYPNGSSFLDHFILSAHLINRNDQNFAVSSLPSFSDHFPLKLQLQLGHCEFVLRSPRRFTSYKNTNWAHFRQDLELLSTRMMPPSNKILKNTEIDQIIIEFNDQIYAIHNVHSEQIAMYNKNIPLPQNIENLFKTKRCWEKDLKKIYHRVGNRLSPDYRLLSKQTQLLKTILKELVAIACSERFGNKLENIKPGPKAFVKINQLIGNKSSPFCQKIIQNGIMTSNSDEISEHFKIYYANIFKENIPDSVAPDVDDRVSQHVDDIPHHIYTFNNHFNSSDNTDNFHFINASKLKSIIANINNKKSSGSDGISNFIIKKLPDTTLNLLTILFNNCLNNCYFPTAWKSAKIIPIKKKDASDRVEDFRPISLLSNIGKLFEHVLKEKLVNSFIIDPISSYQFGFQRHHSTQHALLKFHSDVCCNLRDKKCTVAISLDIKKAFDSAFHKGILFKLVEIGADPFFVKIFKSYFTNRQFYVQIDDKMSTSEAVCSGVPQGSVLAPLLFNLFLHDFPHQMLNSTAILYADDCLIYAHDTSPSQALNKAALHLGVVNVFYQKWGIEINARKSEAICIRNASGKCPRFVVPQSKSLQLSLNGVVIPFKNRMKYLGVVFSNLFKFNHHARTTLTKSKGICGMFSNLLNSKYLPVNTKLLLYKVAIRPILLYGFPIWFAISPSVARELEIHERKILRRCINKSYQNRTKRYSNTYIYQNAGVVPFLNYAMELQKKFIEKLEDHDNGLMNEVLQRENDLNWLSFPYLSPVGILSFIRDNPLDPHATPSFFEKVTSGSHRG